MFIVAVVNTQNVLMGFVACRGHAGKVKGMRTTALQLAQLSASKLTGNLLLLSDQSHGY